MIFKTRFAPSPTGELHIGHAYSALFGYNLAKRNAGEFYLRIDDLDDTRSKKKFEDQIFSDLRWLGLKWNENIIYQSQRSKIYAEKLKILWDIGLLYICSCSRKDIANALSAPHNKNPIIGPDGHVYPGTCRYKKIKKTFEYSKNHALRLDMVKAWDHLNCEYLIFLEAQKFFPIKNKKQIVTREEAIKKIGDVVLSRNNLAASYHLSVVIDDAAQNINNVARGEDLFEATKIHTILYALFNLPCPTYHHHKLIRDSEGKRLAKRDNAKSISYLRRKGMEKHDLLDLINI